MSNKMSRRAFLGGMAALGGSALFAACAPKQVAEVDKSAAQPETKKEDAPAAAPKEDVTLKYASWWGSYNSTIFQPSVDEIKEMLFSLLCPNDFIDMDVPRIPA